MNDNLFYIKDDAWQKSSIKTILYKYLEININLDQEIQNQLS